jgi:hypothetical protein
LKEKLSVFYFLFAKTKKTKSNVSIVFVKSKSNHEKFESDPIYNYPFLSLETVSTIDNQPFLTLVCKNIFYLKQQHFG